MSESSLQSPREILAKARLYGIIDLAYVAAPDALPRTRELISAGVEILQLRAKSLPVPEIERLARELSSLCHEKGVPFIINDHAGVAASVQADGCHVGQDDWPLAQVRKELPPGKIVGKSTHSLTQAAAAAQEGADYIGFGPLYPTPTKLGRPAIGLDDIAEVYRRVRLPVFCIGGIRLENLEKVIAAGARRVVIVSALLQARDLATYVKSVRQLLDNCPPLED